MYRAYKASLRAMSTVGSKLKVVMFLPSVREGRMATRVSAFIQSQLKEKYDIVVFGKIILVSLLVFVCLFEPG